MFGNKDNNSTQGSGHTTLIARGTEVTGELRFSGTLEIEGVVKGNIVAQDGAESAAVRVQPSGEVYGDIVAPAIVINSKVQGNIYSSKRVELAERAEVTGDVHYQIIEMVRGAQVNGGLLYSPAAQPVVEQETGQFEQDGASAAAE